LKKRDGVCVSNDSGSLAVVGLLPRQDGRSRNSTIDPVNAGGAEGQSYSASITEAVRCTLDAKSVRSEMGDAWWNARRRQGVVTIVAVNPRPVSLQLAA
jgi:hypothetical protein